MIIIALVGSSGLNNMKALSMYAYYVGAINNLISFNASNYCNIWNMSFT